MLQMSRGPARVAKGYDRGFPALQGPTYDRAEDSGPLPLAMNSGPPDSGHSPSSSSYQSCPRPCRRLGPAGLGSHGHTLLPPLLGPRTSVACIILTPVHRQIAGSSASGGESTTVIRRLCKLRTCVPVQQTELMLISQNHAALPQVWGASLR
jgi:hypothetical protein